MNRKMAGEAVDRQTKLEELLELATLQVAALQLREPLDRTLNRACAHPRERFGHDVDLFLWETECLAHVPDRHSSPERVDHAAHRRLPGPIGVEDVLEHLLTTMRLHVDIDIRDLLAAEINESF